MPSAPLDPEAISLTDVLGTVRGTLERGKRVVRRLPGGGRLMMDRPLPFICLYRSLPGQEDPGVDELVRAQASYLRFSAAPDDAAALRNILATVASAITPESKAFLVIELWPADRDTNPDTFKAKCPANNLPATSRALDLGLKEMILSIRGAKAEMVDTDQRHPPHLGPLFDRDELRKLGILTIGIEVPPIYWSAEGDYSRLAFRLIRNRLTDVIKRTVFAFVRVQTTLHFPHYLTLGRTTFTRSALNIDRRLARIGASFDVLLNISPVNTEEAWQGFERDHYEKPPDFTYRLIPVDPDIVKRQLFQLRIGEVEDNALEFIFRDKRNELETKLTLLSDRGTSQFLYSSLRLHGTVEPALLQKARDLIAAVDRMTDEPGERMDARTFAALIERELDHYRPLFPERTLTSRVRNDVDGVLVSKGQVYIGDTFTVETYRANALVQHEVGTHVLTWCNGHRQPLQQLHVGLAGYEQLQEGLAVLAEYLCDGIRPQRLKLLAARVVAVDAMIHGASFIDCFRMLTHDLGFTAKHAFRIAMRVYRGGGFAKDAAYLRGLDFIIGHLSKTPDHLDLLYTGKFATRHIRLIEDLHHRGVLKPPVLPPFLNSVARDRVASFKPGMPLEQLLH